MPNADLIGIEYKTVFYIQFKKTTEKFNKLAETNILFMEA